MVMASRLKWRCVGPEHTHRVSAAVWRSMAGRPPRRLIRRQPWRSAATARNGCVPSSKPAGASARLQVSPLDITNLQRSGLANSVLQHFGFQTELLRLRQASVLELASMPSARRTQARPARLKKSASAAQAAAVPPPK